MSRGEAALHRLRLAGLLMLAVLAGGVAGFCLIERWNVRDALFMTVITVSGVGYGETHPLSPFGRAFVILLICSGVATGLFAAGTFAEVVLGEVLRDTLEQRRMQRELAKLKDHVIICGYGRMGQELVEEFRRRRQPHVVIDLNPERGHTLREQGTLCVVGDASDNEVLVSAGIERARCLVTVAPKDADNVFITLSARAICKKLFIVARSELQQDVRKLEIAGADRVISPYVIGARRIAASVVQPTVVDFLDMTFSKEELRWELQEVRIPADAGFAGRSLRDSGIRERSGCTVLAIRCGQEATFSSNPTSAQRLEVGDTLVVLGTPEQLSALRRMASLPPA